MSSSSFFDFCPDILLEIFKYFSLNELFDIFIDLIPHLSSLLNQSHIKLHINKNATEDFCDQILPQINSNQIISLHNSYLTTNLSRFSSIRSINLTLQSSSQFHQFQYLIHLEQLSLQLSETIIQENIWLYYILRLSNLRKLRLDLTSPKNMLMPQKDIFISKSFLKSNTIKYLEIKIPMSWQSLLIFLEHFPCLKIFYASLYRLNSVRDVRPKSISKLSCCSSLQILDLHGYIDQMSFLITHICSSIVNLKICRLQAINVTNDDAFEMKDGLIWEYLFHRCSHLREVKVHLLMSIEVHNHFNTRVIKDLLRTFNDNSFCEKYHFRMEQRSINRGYVTLTGDYDVGKTKFE
jgi:hypothetical protein